ENNSDAIVFIQSGDIVKGGRQDRAMQSDLLVPPHQKMPLPAFCVEHGRWTQRGSESANSFGSSGYALAGKDLKLAAKKEKDQTRVWAYVTAVQTQMSVNLGQDCLAAPSPSSMQLTLESPALKKASADHIKTLQEVIVGQNDAIGYAFAINGKI